MRKVLDLHQFFSIKEHSPLRLSAAQCATNPSNDINQHRTWSTVDPALLIVAYLHRTRERRVGTPVFPQVKIKSTRLRDLFELSLSSGGSPYILQLENGAEHFGQSSLIVVTSETSVWPKPEVHVSV